MPRYTPTSSSSSSNYIQPPSTSTYPAAPYNNISLDTATSGSSGSVPLLADQIVSVGGIVTDVELEGESEDLSFGQRVKEVIMDNQVVINTFIAGKWNNFYHDSQDLYSHMCMFVK